jgi:hypothetical protein
MLSSLIFLGGTYVMVGAVMMYSEIANIAATKALFAGESIDRQVSEVHRSVCIVGLVPVVASLSALLGLEMAAQYLHGAPVWPYVGMLLLVMALFNLLNQWLERQSMGAKKKHIAAFCRWTGTQDPFA